MIIIHFHLQTLCESMSLGSALTCCELFVWTNETSFNKQVSELLGVCRADFHCTIKENFHSAPATCDGLQTFCGECCVTCTISSEVFVHVTCSWSIDLYLNLSFFLLTGRGCFREEKGGNIPASGNPWHVEISRRQE